MLLKKMFRKYVFWKNSSIKLFQHNQTSMYNGHISFADASDWF